MAMWPLFARILLTGLYGRAGNDTLDGGAGEDKLYGEDGDDLIRGGTHNDLIDGGNGVDNLQGQDGDDTLYGQAGDDRLDGGLGNDSLSGGDGNDTYVLGRGYGSDTITENDTTAGNTDVAYFNSGITIDQLWFKKVSNNLEVSIIGTTDKFIMTNWYLGNQYHIEQFKTSDGKTLLDSQVQNLVNAMAGFAPPPGGQTTLTADQQTALSPVIAANWT